MTELVVVVGNAKFNPHYCYMINELPSIYGRNILTKTMLAHTFKTPGIVNLYMKSAK